MEAKADRHAFISYVREDADRVDRLQRILEAAGIRVWRDTEDLWPGEDWRTRIRHAITKNALAFIVCFSEHSEARRVSGQNEEVMLAVDQMRLRRPDQPWLIPVRFDDIDLPDIEIGGGRTLNSIQRADLLGDAWDQGAARLVAGVLRALEGPGIASLPAPAVSLQSQLKAALRDPAGDIALNDILLTLANQVRDIIASDDMFPSTSDALRGSPVEAAFYVADLAETCVEAMNPALDALVSTAQWVREDQAPALTRFVERLIPAPVNVSGMVVLTSLRWLPMLPVIYAGALAALHQDNYCALRAVTLDATVRDTTDGRVPFIGRAHPWRPFSHLELVPQILALRAGGQEVNRQVADDLLAGRQGKRYTPVSDYLYDALRAKFQTEVPDDSDYSDLFDRVEVFLALLAIDVNSQRQDEHVYLDGPYFGRFTWSSRYRRAGETPEAPLSRQLREQNERWLPLRAGLFGGSVERAAAALESFSRGADQARNSRF